MPMFEKWRKTKLQKRKIKKQKKELSMLQKQVFVGISIVVVIGVLITGVWYGTRIESLQITEVEVVGGFTIPKSKIEEVVRQKLNGTYFRLIPQSFRATYPKGAILDAAFAIPRMKNVSVEIIDTKKLLIVFEEYKPYALWCEQKGDTECLFLDTNGFAFSKAPVLTGSAFVRYIDTKESQEIKKQAFETTFMKKSQQFIDLLSENLDLYVTHVEKVDTLDVLYTVSGGGVLKVSQTMSIEKSFKNLQSILSSEDFIHLQNGKFQYIDLRFGDKIFLNEEDVINEVTGDVSTSTEEDNL